VDERLERLLQDVLDLGPGPVPGDLSRSSLEKWDSINHLRLVTAIESEYGIELTMSDVAAIENVTDVESLIGQYQGHVTE
jgi:acyl carrier protein